VRAGRARRAVRTVTAGFADHAGLPEWATAALPDAVLHLLDRWASATEWADREQIIRDAAAQASVHRPALATAALLFPEQTEPDELSSVLDNIDEHGLDPVLDALRDANEHLELLRAWLATPTWDTSHAYALRHPELLADDRTIALLDNADTAEARQHLAIARLARRTSIDDAYDVVTDVAAATGAAMSYLAAADVDAVIDVMNAGPHLYQAPFVGAYLVAAVLTLQAPDHHPDATAAIKAAAAQGTSTQRDAGALRLRQLAANQPDRAERLHELAAILTEPPPGQPD
jgi:hypothetical protein